MNKQYEALKLAIEAIEFQAFGKYKQEVVAKLKEALTEAEKQEPVAWMNINGDIVSNVHKEEGNKFSVQEIPFSTYTTPLYTHPATWQSLSDDEKKSIQNNSWIIHDDGSKEFNTFVFARAIEQALKEKNR